MQLNLAKYRTGRTQFPKQLLEQLQSLPSLADQSFGRDPVSVRSIDPKRAKVREDGLYLGQDKALGVCIVDPSVVLENSSLLTEILSRARILSSGSGVDGLLPKEISVELLSMHGGAKNIPSLSAEVNFDENGLLTGSVKTSAASIVEALTPNQAHQRYQQQDQSVTPLFNRLVEISDLYALRYPPLINAKRAKGPVRDQEFVNTQHIITSGMHIFDTVAMHIAQERKVPLLYWNQVAIGHDATARRAISDLLLNPTDQEIAIVTEQFLSRIELRDFISATPEGHFTHNKTAHAPFTRPLRGILPFVNVVNLSASLRGVELPFSSDNIKEIVQYLTAGRDIHRDEDRRHAHVLLEKKVDQTGYGSLRRKELFRLLLEETGNSAVDQKLVDEVEQRLEQGKFNKVQELAVLAAGPPPGSKKWLSVRKKISNYLNHEAGIPETLVRVARAILPNFESNGYQLQEVKTGWLTWLSATVNGTDYTIPHKLHITSPGQAGHVASFAFWTAFKNGTLVKGKEPPKGKIHQVPTYSHVPIDFELPRLRDGKLDKNAANKLHITCMAAGIGVPQFEKTPPTTENGNHTTTIGGIMGISTQRAEQGHKKDGRATNLTSGDVLADIRTELGIDRIHEAEVIEARKQRWRRRQQHGFMREAPKPLEHELQEPLFYLTGICRANELAAPVVDGAENSGAQVSIIAPDGSQVSEIFQSEHGWRGKVNRAAQKVLDQLPQFFNPSTDRSATVADKSDPSTPLGLGYQLNQGKDIKLYFYNHGLQIAAKLAIEYNGEIFEGQSGGRDSERQAANYAATKAIEGLLHKFPDALEDELPAIPEPVQETETIPFYHLSQIKLLRELQHVCIQQGYSLPKFKVEASVDSNPKIKRTVCQVVTADGDIIEKTAQSKVLGTANRTAVILMLSHIRPQYRQGNIFIRKVNLLREQGLQITEPQFSDKPSPQNPKVQLRQCLLIYDDGKVWLQGGGLRSKDVASESLASQNLLRQLHCVQKYRFRKQQ